MDGASLFDVKLTWCVCLYSFY